IRIKLSCSVVKPNSNIPVGNSVLTLLMLANSCCRCDRPSLSEASAPSCDRAPSTLTDSSATHSLPSPTLRIGLAAGRTGRNEDRGLERKETMRILAMELEQKPRSAASGRERGVGTACHQRRAVPHAAGFSQKTSLGPFFRFEKVL